MKIKRILAVGAVLAAGALALAGCSAPQSEIVSGTALSVAQNSPFTSYNNFTAANNSTYNANITYMTTSTFNYYDSSPKLLKNTKFGTYKVVSKSPLTIKYTIADGVKWSDGQAVDASDMLLAWASQITKYNGKGVNFGAAAAGGGLDLVTKTPKISDNNKSLTLVYDKPFVDWETAFAITVPAHVTYQLAYPGTSAANAKKKMISAINGDDTASLTKIAKAWAKGFDAVSMPKNKSLFLSDGAYTITNLTKDFVTLTANKDYTWGPLPKVSKITVRFIGDPLAQVQALQNGEVSIISGQATSDTIKALQQVKGITTKTTNNATYEHVDLTFNNGGPFDPATYGGDKAKALQVRQAFLKTIPRQDILDKLIKPLNKDAVLDDSQTFLPGANGYSDSVKNNGSDAYSKTDIAGAKELLVKAGITGPLNVKFAYPNDNPRRVNEFQLIQASAKQAGINVVDAGSPGATFFTNLGNGSYDVSVFAWQFTSLAVTGAEVQLKSSDSTTGGNYSGYKNTDTDAAWAKAEVETDKTQQVKLLQQIDKNAWDDAYGVTLYQLPDVSANSNKVSNVSDAPLSPNVFWNFWEWNVKK